MIERWRDMSEEMMLQNVEIDYINAMLGTDDLAVLEKKENFDDVLYQIFSVSSFKVAIPHSELLAIVRANEVDIVNDVLFYESDKYNIINIKFLIKPSGDVVESSQYILLDKNLALTCEEIIDEEIIDKDAVCWRTEKSQRKWLAGTVKNKNIILLDTQSLQSMSVIAKY